VTGGAPRLARLQDWPEGTYSGYRRNWVFRTIDPDLTLWQGGLRQAGAVIPD
jgi:hypothetical protein